MSRHYFLTRKEEERVHTLAKILKTAPAFVADAFGIDPSRIEKLLAMRKEYDPSSDESIGEVVRRRYGQKAFQICMEA